MHNGVKINIIDTPGHADFGGEVERGLTMVDGVLLLVDASEGPLPQTRFVLRKALEARLPVVLVVNKVDRPDARIAEVVHEVEELFLDLDADEHQIDFPILFSNARAGLGGHRAGRGGHRPRAVVPGHPRPHPRPQLRPRGPASGHRVQPGRLPLSRAAGHLPSAQRHAPQGRPRRWCQLDGTVERTKITELFVTDALDRVEAAEAGPGEIAAVAGMAEVTIGETLADPDDPRPLPVITVDEPSLSMTIGINTSPLAGSDGSKLTARQIFSRLESELVGNVSLRVLPTERPDTWEVQGRGELQLAVLVETMRREGFELTVGKPQVVTREIDGKLHEPMERVADRRSRRLPGSGHPADGAPQGHTHRDGQPRHRVGADGLPGAGPRSGRVPHRVHDRDPGNGHAAPRLRRLGARGTASSRPSGTARWSPTGGGHHRLLPMSLQERGVLLVGPATEVYEGMVIGENARDEEMDVNPTKEKKQTNVRARPRRRGRSGYSAAGCHWNRRWSSSPTTSASKSRRPTCGCGRWSSMGHPWADAEPEPQPPLIRPDRPGWRRNS